MRFYEKLIVMPQKKRGKGRDSKTVHFLRHGQGFHNLMADLARAEGREWEQVSAMKKHKYLSGIIILKGILKHHKIFSSLVFCLKNRGTRICSVFPNS